MELRRFHRYGEKKAGVNNKYYEVEATEREDGRADWAFRWGRIGYDPKSKTGTFLSFEAAKLHCEEQFAKKRQRGYREVNAMEALASAVQDPSERKTQGLPAVELVIPCFHAGKSEQRCQTFAQKYVEKLNLIRKSKNVLKHKEYNDQIEALLKAYCAEYKRMKRSKAHGNNLESFADTAFQVFN